jgi:hypothetical protein
VYTLPVLVPGLPAFLQGLRILHVSDLHFVPHRRSMRDTLRTIERFCNASPPDLIAITGDFVEWDDDIEQCAALLAGLRSRLGAFAVLGNHDYGNAFDPHTNADNTLMSALAELAGLPFAVIDQRRYKPNGNNVEHIVDGLATIGIRVLRNEAAPLMHQGQRFWLCGMDEPHQRRQTNAAFQAVPEDEPCILLAHSPEVLELRLARQPLLTLVGHAHGGQVCLPLLPPPVTHTRVHLPRYRGTIQTEQGLMHLTTGVGASVPLRIGCRPEAVLLELGASALAGPAPVPTAPGMTTLGSR